MMAKPFSASLLQSSVSHDPSEMLICCSRNIHCYQCKKSYCENCDLFFRLFDEQYKTKYLF